MTLARPAVLALTACLALAACGRQDETPSAAAPVATATTAVTPAAVLPAPRAPSAPEAAVAVPSVPPEIALAGVVAFGETDPRSQALIEVSGGAAQVFHPGEELAPGWRLRSIAPDHVVIAQGETTRRIELSAPSRATSQAAVASAARAAAADKPLPGFVQTAPPRHSATDGQATQRNRAFLEGVQAARAQRQQQQQQPLPQPPQQR